MLDAKPVLIARLQSAPEAVSTLVRDAYEAAREAGLAERLGLVETVVALLAQDTPTSPFARGLFDGLWAGYGDDTELGWEEGELARDPDLLAEALMMTTRRLPSWLGVEMDPRAFEAKVLVWLEDGAARRLTAVDRRRVALFERTLGRDEQDLARARAELARLAGLFAEDHPAIVRTQIALARVHVNRGELEEALGVLDSVRSEDPKAVGLVRYASQLAGCSRICVGEVSDGIAQLERARVGEAAPAAPNVRHLHTASALDSALDASARGLLMCFVLPRALPSFSPYDQSSTLRCLRGLADALKEAGRPRDAAAVRKARRAWAAKARESPRPTQS